MRKAKIAPVRGEKELADMRLYTLAELEPVLGVKVETLKRYIKDNRLKGVFIAGKWRVSARSVREFIDKGSMME